MKYVIDGKTYNTDTAIKVASYSEFLSTVFKVVYRTTSGIFFVTIEESSGNRCEVLHSYGNEELWSYINNGENLKIHNESILPYPEEA
jgi:hypothetical protein